MKIKTFVLSNLLIFLFSISSFAAVDIKKEETIINQKHEKELLNKSSSYKKSNSNFFKKIKFRLQELFKFKKKKTEETQKEIPLTATLSAMLASVGTISTLFLWLLAAKYSITIPFLVLPFLAFGFVAAFILGLIGSTIIRSDKERYGGIRLALFGILVGITWIFISALIFLLFI